MHSLVQPRRQDRHYALSPAAYDATLDALEASAGVFRNRAEAIASTIPTAVDRIAVRHGPVLLWYLHDPLGTAMQTAGGRWWSPADTATPLHWGAAGNGTGDDGPAMSAALAWSRRVDGAGATYRIASRVDVTAPGRTLDMTGARIICADALGGDAAIRFIGDGIGVDVATVTAPIARTADTLSLDDTGAIAAGDWLAIVSTEYKMGVTGVSGHGPRSKGEYVEVREVVSATEIALVGTVADTYSTEAETVIVRKVTFLRDAEVLGGAWESTFVIGGGAPPGQSNRNSAQRAIQFDGVLGARVSGGRFVNFSDDIISFSRSCQGTFSDNQLVGPTGTTSSLPSESDLWGKGLGVVDGQGVLFANNICRRLRRPVDAETGSALGTLSRDITMDGNSIEGCFHFIGTHACDGFVATNNHGTAYTFCAYRGTNLLVQGNTCKGVRGGVCFQVGLSPSNSSHSERPDHGRIVVSGNVLHGEVTGEAIWIRGSVAALHITNNTWPEALNGLRVNARFIGTLDLTGNTFCSLLPAQDAEGPEPGTGVTICNPANVPLEDVGSIRIGDNTFMGLYRYGIMVMGTAFGAGAGPVSVLHNRFQHVVSRVVSFIPITGHVAGERGHFAVPPMVEGNTATRIDFPEAAFYDPGSGAFASLNPYVIDGAPVGPFRLARPGRSTDASTTPHRSYLRGTRIEFAEPGPGEPSMVVCVQSGTTGSLSGVTGSIDAGSDRLTVNDTRNISVGSHISVAGAGLPDGCRVVACHGSVLTLSHAAASSVVDAAVTRVAPEFRACAPVEV